MFGPIKKSLRNFLEAKLRAQKEFEWDDAPRLDLSGVPEKEAKDASLLAFHLWMLASYTLQFWHAIRLIDLCEELDDDESDGYPATAWTNMAAIHAALTVYHFRATLHAISARVGNCPSLSGQIDTKAIQQAIDRFKTEFPYAKEVRDAAGHFADRMFKPADIDEHSHADGGILMGAVWHRALMFSHKGEVVGLDINERNFERLLGLKRQVYGAFKDIPLRKRSTAKEAAIRAESKRPSIKR